MDTMNKKEILHCWCWWHDLLFFLNQFLRLVILLLLHLSGKLAIPHDHLFLLLNILHLVLFKLLQRQGKLSIFGDSRIVFWWARDDNRRLLFLKRANLPFVWNGFVAIYFWSIFICQFWKFVLLVLQQCSDDCVIIGGRWTRFEMSGCAIDLVYGAHFKCKRKQWFVFYAFLWTCRVTDYWKISSVGNCIPRTCQGRWRGGRWRAKCQLGRWKNQRCGAQARTHQKDFLAQWFVDITEFFPDTTVFYD